MFSPLTHAALLRNVGSQNSCYCLQWFPWNLLLLFGSCQSSLSTQILWHSCIFPNKCQLCLWLEPLSVCRQSMPAASLPHRSTNCTSLIMLIVQVILFKVVLEIKMIPQGDFDGFLVELALADSKYAASPHGLALSLETYRSYRWPRTHLCQLPPPGSSCRVSDFIQLSRCPLFKQGNRGVVGFLSNILRHLSFQTF